MSGYGSMCAHRLGRTHRAELAKPMRGFSLAYALRLRNDTAAMIDDSHRAEFEQLVPLTFGNAWMPAYTMKPSAKLLMNGWMIRTMGKIVGSKPGNSVFNSERLEKYYFLGHRRLSASDIGLRRFDC